jgi:hypothetical protein
VGAGIEWAFAPNWSAKVEYNYLGLDDRTFVVPAGTVTPLFLAGDTFTQSNRNIQDGEGGHQLPVQLEQLWLWLWPWVSLTVLVRLRRLASLHLNPNELR